MFTNIRLQNYRDQKFENKNIYVQYMLNERKIFNFVIQVLSVGWLCDLYTLKDRMSHETIQLRDDLKIVFHLWNNLRHCRANAEKYFLIKDILNIISQLVFFCGTPCIFVGGGDANSLIMRFLIKLRLQLLFYTGCGRERGGQGERIF